RISQVSQNDSLSATVSFNSPLAPGQRFDSTNVVLRLQRDSSIIPIRSVLPRELDDSLQKIARATADSLRVERDTTILDSVKRARLRPPPVSKAPALGQRQGRPGRVDSEADSIIKSRPRLIPSLVIRVDSAWVPETKYLIEVTGVKSAAGVPGTSKSVLAIPKRVVPPARDSLKVTRDSLKTARDSLKVQRDTLKADTAGARPIIKKPFKKPATP
ncbi:MAG TPA: hypothetical protein VLD58_15900, partial [Gemmatimonadales bacterium]|nr:hypothetical protein [Gemmatimonadales bacterium]